jgi:hypothetical protein
MALFLVTSLITAGISFWGRRAVSQFLAQHPAIESDASLKAFKTLVRRQMHVSLVALAIGFILVVLCLMMTMQMGLVGLLVVISLSMPIFLLARNAKKLETKARSLVCSDERRRLEYSSVASAWTGKLFPDF